MQHWPPATPFTPALVSALKAGYTRGTLRADAVAGLTVAIVAVPLSMAFAIASGLPPAAGLITAVVGGFLVSALGGSRYQIGGPAGAFIVLIASIVTRHGYDGLVLATAMAGVFITIGGLLRVGSVVRLMPVPVVAGFTAGIAAIIFASQLKELFGLTLPSEPGALLPKLAALAAAAGTASPYAMAVAAGSLAIILVLRRLNPAIPGMLIAVAASAVAAYALGLPVATIGSRFGDMAGGLPMPSFPAASLARLVDLLPDALALALLGCIESLLSAVVADGMTGGWHRSNGELVAQGIANVASVAFGGIPVTGTVARTATNIRAGGRTPVSGMLHACFVLAFMLLAAPLARYVPLAALGAVLAVVAYNMAGWRELRHCLRTRNAAVVCLATFLLTVLYDLTAGIAAGVILSALPSLWRRVLNVAHGDGRAA